LSRIAAIEDFLLPKLLGYVEMVEDLACFPLAFRFGTADVVSVLDIASLLFVHEVKHYHMETMHQQ
jgi:hypothetical protein